MACEIENENAEMMETEVLSSMWPEDVAIDDGKQFNIEEAPEEDQDMFKEVNIVEEPAIADFKRLLELTSYSEKGSSQLAYLVKSWEYKQANAVRLLKEELDILSRQRQEFELKRLEIQEEHRFEEERFGGDKRPVSILDELYDIWQEVPRRKSDVKVRGSRLEVDFEYDTVAYWKQRALHFEELLEASIQREQMLMEKLEEKVKNLERQSSPVEELSQILKRADNFLHFILQTAPVVIGHQDKDLRYRFIYNHFPSFKESDIIGKTDVEIFTGGGVKESQEFKREVLEKGRAAKREITFDTPLFGSKTFLIYVEPVFSKAGETIGVNYMGMEVTDQVIKREKMAKLREEIAVQKAKETELNKTIHITEETMRAKQMLATMSHEIRSPLSGVVSMAEILSNTRLDREQKQLLDVMLSSGDLVLQLINDILDLSKVESGVMKLEATKFHPREVVKHVLQTAAASLQKMLTLEGHVAEDVPIEVIGDVLRIRQILTNLISNAIKFTHEGKVGIKIYMVSEPSCDEEKSHRQTNNEDQSVVAWQKEDEFLQKTLNGCKTNGIHHGESPRQSNPLNEPKNPPESDFSTDEDQEGNHHTPETTVWLRCDVYDTGIGIPENALPILFKKYMQVGADHARKYGGTGLGLAICKQLVELMGGSLTVSSKEHIGSTFTFVLPYKVSNTSDNSDDSDELSDMADHKHPSHSDDITAGFFQFQPRTLGSLFSSGGSNRSQNLSVHRIGNSTQNTNGSSQISYSFPSGNTSSDDSASLEDSKTADEVDVLSKLETSVQQTTDQITEVDRSQQNQDAVESQLQKPCIAPVHHLEQSDAMDAKATVDEVQEKRQKLDKSEASNSCDPTCCREVTKAPSKPKILLVEDNKINVMVTQNMMKQLGHSIDVVNNGVEAVQAVQRHIYDLILMDVCMPVMDGLKATRIVRSFEENGNWDAAKDAGIEQSMPSSDPPSNGHRRRVPIIAMTANALSESADECFANGMDSFVSKPVTFQKLKQCLEQYLS